MLSYFDLFPEKCGTELRTATFPKGDDLSFPAGRYVFTEYYCSDLACDCQRLLVKVLHESESVLNEMATISYTWNEHPDPLWEDVIGESSNPFLDPFHPQADCANEIMDFWYDMVCYDQEYAERLRKHYAELRRMHGQRSRPAVDDAFPGTIADTATAEKKRRRRLLCKKQKKRRKPRRPK